MSPLLGVRLPQREFLKCFASIVIGWAFLRPLPNVMIIDGLDAILSAYVKRGSYSANSVTRDPILSFFVDLGGSMDLGYPWSERR